LVYNNKTYLTCPWLGWVEGGSRRRRRRKSSGYGYDRLLTWFGVCVDLGFGCGEVGWRTWGPGGWSVLSLERANMGLGSRGPPGLFKRAEKTIETGPDYK
jgi:hypothetical protein